MQYHTNKLLSNTHLYNIVLNNIKYDKGISYLLYTDVISKKTLVYGLILLGRYLSVHSIIRYKFLYFLTYTCIYIAHKMLDDYSKTLNYFAHILKIEKNMLKKLEMNILYGIDYDVHIHPDLFEVAESLITVKLN